MNRISKNRLFALALAAGMLAGVKSASADDCATNPNACSGCEGSGGGYNHSGGGVGSVYATGFWSVTSPFATTSEWTNASGDRTTFRANNDGTGWAFTTHPDGWQEQIEFNKRGEQTRRETYAPQAPVSEPAPSQPTDEQVQTWF